MMSCSYLTSAVLTLVILVGMPMPEPVYGAAAREEVIRSGGLDQGALVEAVLPKGAILVHPPVAVDLGDGRRSIVALYRASAEATVFAGLVLVPGQGEDLRVTALPPPREVDGLWELDVTSIFTVRVNKDRPALVVLYRAQRIGTGDAPVRAGYVYGPDGQGWQIHAARTARLVGVLDASAARARLREKH